jgi:hypothetical protein
MTPTYVVTGYDPAAMQTETVGASPVLDEAKALAAEHRLMLDETTPGHPIRMFIEEWHVGVFHSQRELRDDDEWWISEAPLFLPIKES